MKKILLICSLVFAIILCACGKQADTAVNSEETDPNQANSLYVNSEPEILGTDDHIEPPKQLSFSSLEELNTLRSCLEKTDEELIAYLSSRSLDVNGLSSRQDVEDFFARILSFPMATLDVSGWEVGSVLYYPDDDILLVFYHAEDCMLVFKYSADLEINKRAIETYDAMELITSVTGQTCTLSMFKAPNEESAYSAYGYLLTGDTMISFSYSGDIASNPLPTVISEGSLDIEAIQTIVSE